MRSSMTKLRFTKKFEIELDSNKLKWFYMSCVAALPQLDRGSDYESERHRFESYTPHQSNLKPPATGAFLLRRHRMDSNLGRGAGVKKRGAFSARGRARRQAGEAGADPRSGCAESYTPHHLRLKLPATGAFLLRQLECFRPKGRFPVDSCKIPSRCRGPSATTPSLNDRSG